MKITYSGDAAPSPELVNIGLNSDVLIHEATMEDDLEESARLARHSTISQAIEAGQKMNARFIILTHFSNRYGKIPRIEKPVVNVIIAFDNAEFSLSDLPTAHLMFEPLMAMFSKEIARLEDRATLRKRKDEREVRMIQSLKTKARTME